MAFSFATSTTAPNTNNNSFSFGAPSATNAPSTFGTPSTTAAPSGFSFGASTPGAATSGFGTSTPATSGGFGFGTSAPNTAPTAATGLGFGATASTPATTSAFGVTPAATPTAGFGFGAPASSTGFGAPAATSTFGAPAATSTFGAPAATSTFGAPATTSTFGAPAVTSGFGFGAAAPSAFGTPAPAPVASSFGFAAASPAPTSLFGSTTPSAFGAPASSTFGNAAPSASPASVFGCAATDSPEESLTAIKRAYQDPQHSRFKHMFYNVVGPNQRAHYLRPSHISERLWKQAEADNPDVENCVPAAVVGFEQLSEKIITQQQHTEMLQNNVSELREKVKSMSKAGRSTELTMKRCREQHIHLSHKLLDIMKKVEVFKCLQKPFHAEEVQLRDTLQSIQKQLNMPMQFKAQLAEMMTVQSSTIMDNNTNKQPIQLDPSDMEKVYQILQRQRIGLQHLKDIVENDLKHLQIVQKGMSHQHSMSRSSHVTQ